MIERKIVLVYVSGSVCVRGTKRERERERESKTCSQEETFLSAFFLVFSRAIKKKL